VARPLALPAAAVVVLAAGCGGGGSPATTTVTRTVTRAPARPARPVVPAHRGATVEPRGANYAYRVPAGMRLLTRPGGERGTFGFRFKTAVGFTTDDRVEVAQQRTGHSYDRDAQSYFRGPLIDTLRSSLLESNASVSPGSYARRRGERSVSFSVQADAASRPLVGAQLYYFYFGHVQLLVTCEWTSAGATRVRRACDRLTHSLTLKRAPSARNSV
jgi:hypothetical protein